MVPTLYDSNDGDFPKTSLCFAVAVVVVVIVVVVVVVAVGVVVVAVVYHIQYFSVFDHFPGPVG